MPTAYAPGGGSSTPTSSTQDLAQEAVGDLGEDAGAVAGVGFGAGGAAVLEVRQGDRVRCARARGCAHP